MVKFCSTLFIMSICVYAKPIPEYATNVWIWKNEKGEVNYGLNRKKSASINEILNTARKVCEIDKEFSIHIIADKNVSLIDLFRACKIIEKGGLKNIVVTVFLEDLKEFKPLDGVKLESMEFITVSSKGGGLPIDVKETSNQKPKTQDKPMP